MYKNSAKNNSQKSQKLKINTNIRKIIFLPDDAFRAGLRKLGPKNNIPEVFLTKKAKKHESRKSPIPYYIVL